MRVLYIASNPDELGNLRLEREITEFQRDAVASSGEPVEFLFLPSLPFEEIPSQISKHKPDIVHISAHGENGSLEIAHGGEKPVRLTSEILCAFLDIEPLPQLVYLNACNSESIAQDLIKKVPMAIGTTAPITNRAARKAAVNFYSRLLDGKSVESAFATGQMIINGLDNNTVTSKLFVQPGVDPKSRIMHVPTRIVARFRDEKMKPRRDDHYEFFLGISGAPRNTIQVVFFTDDETYIKGDESLEEDLSSIVRTTAVRGEIWLGHHWAAYGDLRVFACGITAAGDHFSVGKSLCEALESYYVSTYGLPGASSLPAYVQRAIGNLRRMDGASIPKSRDNRKRNSPPTYPRRSE